MTHYCPTCHGRMPADPADIHVCVLPLSPSEDAPSPNSQDRINLPSPRALRLREALIGGLCHGLWTALFVAVAYVIVWANPPY